MTDIDLAAIRERYAAWKRISDAGNDDLGEGTVAMLLAGNDVPLLLAAVDRLTAELTEVKDLCLSAIRAEVKAVQQVTAERDQVACERDGIREELARMAGDLDDTRADRNQLRVRLAAEQTARLQADRRTAAMRPVVEAAVAWRASRVGSFRPADHALAAAVDAYTAQTPGVDTGTSEARTADSGDAGPADGVDSPERPFVECLLPIGAVEDDRWCDLPVGHTGACSAPLIDATGETP